MKVHILCNVLYFELRSHDRVKRVKLNDMCVLSLSHLSAVFSQVDRLTEMCQQELRLVF